MKDRNVRLDESLRTEDNAKGEDYLGLSEKANSNGLRELAGMWSEEDQSAFNAAVAPLAKIDANLWR